MQRQGGVASGEEPQAVGVAGSDRHGVLEVVEEDVVERWGQGAGGSPSRMAGLPSLLTVRSVSFRLILGIGWA